MKKKTEIVKWVLPGNIPQDRKLAKEVVPLVQRAQSFDITTEDHFIASWAIILQLDSAIKKVEEMWDPFCSGLDKMHKMATRMRKGFLKPLTTQKQRLHDIRYLWIEKQQKAKDAATAKMAQGLQAQQQRDLEKQARAEDRKGNTEAAEALREQAASVQLPLLNTTPAVPKQEGAVLTERWIFEIIDADAVEREWCSPDPKKIRPIVEAMGDKCKISGLKITLDKSEHSRKVS